MKDLKVFLKKYKLMVLVAVVIMIEFFMSKKNKEKMENEFSGAFDVNEYLKKYKDVYLTAPKGHNVKFAEYIVGLVKTGKILPTQGAYILATVHHECGFDLLVEKWGNKYRDPITLKVIKTGIKSAYEYFEFAYGSTPGSFKVARAKKMGNTSAGDGYKYRGRGFGQLTWKTNYQKASKLLGVDLVNNPDLALDFDNSVKIIVSFMTGADGYTFTGAKLSRYVNENKTDFVNARRVVNGDVSVNGAKIAKYAEKYLKILKEL